MDFSLTSGSSSTSNTGEENSWWGSWLEAAKEKSAAALEQVSKDLQEFTSTIQKDASQAVASSATVIGNTLKKENNDEEDEEKEPSTSDSLREGFYNILSNISQSLQPTEGATGDDYQPLNKDSAVFDQAEARLHNIQTDPATYCTEPDGHPEFFEKWLETFKVDEHKGEISELLVAKTEVRSLYTKLVPAAVSHAEFWSRYFYKIHQLSQDEARRKELKQRASSFQHLEEEELGWGDEDETWDTMPDLQSEGLPTEDTEKSLETPKSVETEKSLEHEGESSKDGEVEFHIGQEAVSNNGVVSSNHESDTKNSNTSLQSTENKSETSPTIAKTEICEENSERSEGTSVQEEESSAKENETENNKDEVDGKVERSPTQLSDGSSGNKESSSLGDEWEKDFDDIEITEEDIKNAALAKDNVNDDVDLDDWESWE